ncbi:unnamed protein product, partial [Protopolystoma xenopodis]
VSGDGAESIVTGGGISTNNQHRPPPLPIKEGEETEEALADTKRTLFGAWHAEAAASGGRIVVHQTWQKDSPAVIRYSYNRSNQLYLQQQQASESIQTALKSPSPTSSRILEQFEMRYEPELKVFEVPEELCTSPSALSLLESDESEEDDLVLPQAVISSCPASSSAALTIFNQAGQKSCPIAATVSSCDTTAGYAHYLHDMTGAQTPGLLGEVSVASFIAPPLLE